MHKWSKSILECVKSRVDCKGLDNLELCDIEELELWTRIAKNIVCFDKDYKIVEAMEEAENGENMEMIEQYEDYPERMYYSPMRSKTSGRYMSSGDGRYSNGRMYTPPQPMYRMDMDLYRMSPEELRRKDMDMGVHYYTDSGNSNMSNGSNSENGMNMNRNNMNMNRPESRMERAVRHYTENKDMQSLEEMMNAIQEKIMEEAGGMDSSKKNMTKSKLTNLVNMIK